MRRTTTLVVAVMIAAVLVGSSVAAYAKQSTTSDNQPTTSDKQSTTSDNKTVTSENHSWGGYHWARQSPANGSFTLKLSDKHVVRLG